MKLYKATIEVVAYFTVADDEDADDVAYDAMREELSTSPCDCDPVLVKAGEVPEGNYDVRSLVYGSHDGNLTLGAALAMIPGHAEACAARLEAFKRARAADEHSHRLEIEGMEAAAKNAKGIK